MALLGYCQSGAAGFLFVRCLHWSVEEVSVDTAVKTLDGGEEEEEGYRRKRD